MVTTGAEMPILKGVGSAASAVAVPNASARPSAAAVLRKKSDRMPVLPGGARFDRAVLVWRSEVRINLAASPKSGLLTKAMKAWELRDLEQDFRQAVGHVDHDVMAARHLVDAPAGGRLELVASSVERRVRIADGADVGLLGDAVARAGQARLVGEGRERLRRAHAVDPGAVLLVHLEHRRRHRLHRRLPFLRELLDGLAARGQARHALAVLRHEGIEEH